MKKVLGRGKTSAFRRQEALSGAAALLAVGLIVLAPECAVADEGGVGFWLPGEFGSLAAAPQVPGWAVGIINVYELEQASGGVAAAREITINKGSVPVNVNQNLNLSAHAENLLVSARITWLPVTFRQRTIVSVQQIRVRF